MGIPEEFTEVDFYQAKIEPGFYEVECLEERPHEAFRETRGPRLWGRVRINGMLTSFRGMSGGPILALHEDSHGQLSYWIVALQTHEVTNTPFIAGCFTKWLGDALETAIDEAVALMRQEKGNLHDSQAET